MEFDAKEFAKACLEAATNVIRDETETDELKEEITNLIGEISGLKSVVDKTNKYVDDVIKEYKKPKITPRQITNLHNSLKSNNRIMSNLNSTINRNTAAVRAISAGTRGAGGRAAKSEVAVTSLPRALYEHLGKINKTLQECCKGMAPRGAAGRVNGDAPIIADAGDVHRVNQKLGKTHSLLVKIHETSGRIADTFERFNIIGDIFGGIIKHEIDFAINMRRIAYETRGVTREMRETQDALVMIGRISAVTGHRRVVFQQEYVKHLRRGIIAEGESLRNVRSALSLSTMIGSEVGQTSELFQRWHMHLGYSAQDMAIVSRHMQDVARSSGVTGDNLMRAAQASEKILKHMRDARGLTVDASRQVMGLLASAEKLGVADEMTRIMEAGASATQFYLHASQETRLLMIQIANEMGKLHELTTGEFFTGEGASRDMAEGIERMIKRITGVTVDQLDQLSAEQRRSYNLIFERLVGMELGVLERIHQAAVDHQKTYMERITELSDMLNNQRLTFDEQIQIQQDLLRLQTTEGLKHLTTLEGILRDDSLIQGYQRMYQSMSDQQRQDLRNFLGTQGRVLGDSISATRAMLMQTSKHLEEAGGKSFAREIDRALRISDPDRQAAAIREVVQDMTKQAEELGVAQKQATDPITELAYNINKLNDLLSQYSASWSNMLLEVGKWALVVGSLVYGVSSLTGSITYLALQIQLLAHSIAMSRGMDMLDHGMRGRGRPGRIFRRGMRRAPGRAWRKVTGRRPPRLPRFGRGRMPRMPRMPRGGLRGGLGAGGRILGGLAILEALYSGVMGGITAPEHGEGRAAGALLGFTTGSVGRERGWLASIAGARPGGAGEDAWNIAGAGARGALIGGTIGSFFGPGPGTAIGAVLGGLVGSIAETTKVLRDENSELGQGLRDVWQTYSHHFKEFWGNIFSSIGSWFSNVFSSIGSWFGLGSGEVPHFQAGGHITRTGMALVHAGETIIPAADGHVGFRGMDHSALIQTLAAAQLTDAYVRRNKEEIDRINSSILETIYDRGYRRISKELLEETRKTDQDVRFDESQRKLDEAIGKYPVSQSKPLPKYDEGGVITETGLGIVDRGETIIPESVLPQQYLERLLRDPPKIFYSSRGTDLRISDPQDRYGLTVSRRGQHILAQNGQTVEVVPTDSILNDIVDNMKKLESTPGMEVSRHIRVPRGSIYEHATQEILEDVMAALSEMEHQKKPARPAPPFLLTEFEAAKRGWPRVGHPYPDDAELQNQLEGLHTPTEEKFMPDEVPMYTAAKERLELIEKNLARFWGREPVLEGMIMPLVHESFDKWWNNPSNLKGYWMPPAYPIELSQLGASAQAIYDKFEEKARKGADVRGTRLTYLPPIESPFFPVRDTSYGPVLKEAYRPEDTAFLGTLQEKMAGATIDPYYQIDYLSDALMPGVPWKHRTGEGKERLRNVRGDWYLRTILAESARRLDSIKSWLQEEGNIDKALKGGHFYHARGITGWRNPLPRVIQSIQERYDRWRKRIYWPYSLLEPKHPQYHTQVEEDWPLYPPAWLPVEDVSKFVDVYGEAMAERVKSGTPGDIKRFFASGLEHTPYKEKDLAITAVARQMLYTAGHQVPKFEDLPDIDKLPEGLVARTRIPQLRFGGKIVADGPGLFMAGEAGPEEIRVTPLSRLSGVEDNLFTNIQSIIAESIGPLSPIAEISPMSIPDIHERMITDHRSAEYGPTKVVSDELSSMEKYSRDQTQQLSEIKEGIKELVSLLRGTEVGKTPTGRAEMENTYNDLLAVQDYALWPVGQNSANARKQALYPVS